MAFVYGLPNTAMAASAGGLFDDVRKACDRMAKAGWRDLLLSVTHGVLDLRGSDLRAQLVEPLGVIDRSVPGFGDFALSGTRAIEPGIPARSLLYHAFASPQVIADAHGNALSDFPTPAELEAIENYVYGVRPPTVADVRARARGNTLGLVVFALGYRNAEDSVQGRHADLCFSRTGIARLGTREPYYDARARAFDGNRDMKPGEFHVVPQRFAVYLAMQVHGADPLFGPQDAQHDDKDLNFWVPLHKLFNGKECIAGLNIAVDLSSNLQNEKLRKFHRYLETQGYQNDWTGDDLNNFPFVIRNEAIGGLSRDRAFGNGLLEPRPHPLATAATYRGEPLAFTVDPKYASTTGDIYFSSAQMLPGAAETQPTYYEGVDQQTDRPGPEYLNIRHPVEADGRVGNINRSPDLTRILHAGGYKALHYIDFAGEGWIEATCAALAGEVNVHLPAYCLVAPPDFFPRIDQREMMRWWQDDVPAALREGLWAIPPLTLSQRRIAANVTLPAGFSINDTTVTTLVSQPMDSCPQQKSNGVSNKLSTGLPDSSPGLFDPGWDASQGIFFSDPDQPLQRFLQGYGLGTPFVEDVKLCAALGSYWPAIAPDSTRTFAPAKRGPQFDYPWPTIAPLTDAEIGTMPLPDGTLLPWDGVTGPRLKTIGGRLVCAYPDIMRVDYIDIAQKITGVELQKIDSKEYQRRILAMAAIYWSLGIRDPEILERYGAARRIEAVKSIMTAKSSWAVLSFCPITTEDPQLAEAEQATHQKIEGTFGYRFHVFRPGAETVDPDDIATVLVDVGEQIIAYTNGRKVLLSRNSKPWQCDATIPTS